MTGQANPYGAETRRVISVDGEGQDYHGRHAYTLLAAADDRGLRVKIDHDGTIRPGTGTAPFSPDDVAPNHGLSTVRCLEFLLGLPKKRGDLVISFSFTYDVTKILQDLRLKFLVELADTGRVQWGRYTIEHLPRKFLKIRKGNASVTVWDTFTYWQMSFVNALQSNVNKKGFSEIFTQSQIEKIQFIAEMKGNRGELEKQTPEDILEYCYTECEYLSIMFRDLLVHAEKLNLPMRRFSGPGAVADAFFEKERIVDTFPLTSILHSAPGLPISVPFKSMYGGRFEIAVQGGVGGGFENDIHSAYPAIAVTLPCLNCGFFERVTEFVPGLPGFYYVESHTDPKRCPKLTDGRKNTGRWAPFPFRIGKDPDVRNFFGGNFKHGALPGSIAYPHGGRRWVTSYEVETARKWFGEKAIPVLVGYVYKTKCSHKPFRELSRLYEERKSPNSTASDGYKKIIKLIINSVYGKLAQAIGEKINEYGELTRPKFQCLIYAAWITGGTRAKVLDAALRSEDVVSIATDGILTTKQIPEADDFVKTDWELGTWDEEIKEDIFLLMPGIYSVGTEESGKQTFKRRGLEAKYFPATYLRERFENGHWEAPPLNPETGNSFQKCRVCKNEPDRKLQCSACKGTGNGKDVFQPSGFMPLRLAVRRKNSLDVIGEWPKFPKQVKFASVRFKRAYGGTGIFSPVQIDGKIVMEEEEFSWLNEDSHPGKAIPLIPYVIPDTWESEPYRLRNTIQEVNQGKDSDLDIPMWDDEDDPDLFETDYEDIEEEITNV